MDGSASLARTRYRCLPRLLRAWLQERMFAWRMRKPPPRGATQREPHAESAERFLRPRQRWGTPGQVAIGMVATTIGNEFRDEVFGVRWQEPLRVPSDHRPVADRLATVDHGCGPNALAGNAHR